MSRLALPTNYTVTAGTLFESFDDTADWAAANSVITDNGDETIKLTQSGGAYGAMTKAINQSFDAVTTMTLRFYVADRTAISSVLCYMFTLNNESKYFVGSFGDSSQTRNGWNTFTIRKSAFSDGGSGAVWTDNIVKLRFRFNTADGHYVVLDSFWTDGTARPKVIIAFDDANNTIYTEGYTYMATKKLPGTLYLIPSYLDTGANLTTAQVQTMAAAGWDISCHGETDLTTLSLAAAGADMDATLTEVATIDPVGAYHYAWPGGASNSDLQSLAASKGFLTARGTLNDVQTTIFGLDNAYNLTGKQILNTNNLATAQGFVDRAATKSGTVVLIFHVIETPAGAATKWPVADFQSLIDYIATAQAAGTFDVVTMSEWYAGLTRIARIDATTGRPAY